MTKEQQDLAWACLPKEARNKIISAYVCNKTSGNQYNMGYSDALRQLYGKHNLTSDTEPEEMLIVERKKVQEMFNTGDRNSCATLASLFGDKCLPNKEGVDLDKLNQMLDETLEKETTESMKEWLESQKHPKFKVGDKVRVIEEGIYKGFITEVIGIDESDEDCPYQIDSYRAFEEGRWFSDSDLEPYTEENKETKFDIGQKVRVKGTKQIGTIKEPYSNDTGYRVYFEDGNGGWDKEYSANELEHYTKEKEIMEECPYTDSRTCNTCMGKGWECGYKPKETMKLSDVRDKIDDYFDTHTEEEVYDALKRNGAIEETMEEKEYKHILQGDLIEIKGKEQSLKAVVTELTDDKYVKVQPIGLTCTIYVERKILKQDNPEIYGK